MKTVKTATRLRTIWKQYHDAWHMKPDEFIFFVWLFLKASRESYKKFRAPLREVEEQVRIKRKRQEVIIQKFVGMGWLNVTIEPDDNGVPYRTFFVDVSILAEPKVLIELFNPCEEMLELFQEISKSL